MGKAKDILLKPIDSRTANELVRRVHYSGKVVNNSQIHIGVYYHGKLEGAFQFGPSLDKRKIQGLVTGTEWHEFIELNRLAFTDVLPRNSESRAIAVCMRLLRKHATQLKWVVSFADGTQCGDGTIYRASGFVLTMINPQSSTWILPNGESVRENTIRQSGYTSWLSPYISKNDFDKLRGGGSKSAIIFKNIDGAKKMPGFQLRYIYFLDPTYRERLTVPELPFSEIERMGARMYKGQKIQAGG